MHPVPLPLPDGFGPGGRYDDWRPAHPVYVVMDVDGTLIGPARHARDAVVAAVAEAQASGLHVGFATGRMRLAVEPLQDQLAARGPHLFHDGAEVRHEGATVVDWPLDARHLEAIGRLAAEQDLYAELYVPDGYWVTDRRDAVRAHWEILGRDPLGVCTTPERLDQDVLKVTFVLVDTPTDDLVRRLRALGVHAGPAGSPLTPGLRYVNATHPDAGKGRALQAAAEHLGAELSAVVAVGDGANDLPMFARAGTAIAMGQAPRDVAAAAHLVAPDVDADGAAAALRAVTTWRTDPTAFAPPGA